jgi:hypothetical protein
MRKYGKLVSETCEQNIWLKLADGIDASIKRRPAE